MTTIVNPREYKVTMKFKSNKLKQSNLLIKKHKEYTSLVIIDP